MIRRTLIAPASVLAVLALGTSVVRADSPAPAPAARPLFLNAAPPPTPPPPPPVQPATPAVRAAVTPCAPPRPMPPPRAPYAAPCEAPCPAPLGCCQPRDACGWPIDSCGRRYGSVELTLEGMYSFTQDPSGPFGEQTYGAGNQIGWDILNYKGEFGGRATLGIHSDPENRFDLRGTYYGKWSDSASTTGVFGASPGASGTGDVSRTCIAALSDEAKCWSGELNWWHEISCSGHWRTDVGLGFRYLKFDETAHADLTALGTGPFPVADGFVDSAVENRFIGAQLLGAVHYDASDCVEFGFSAKALVGSLNRKITVTDDSIFAGGVHSSTSEDEEVVFGFETEVGFRWRWTSWLALTGGYQMLFLDNVQRAHQAMDFSHSNSGAVQAQQNPDQLLVHSLFLGFNLNF